MVVRLEVRDKVVTKQGQEGDFLGTDYFPSRKFSNNDVKGMRYLRVQINGLITLIKPENVILVKKRGKI